MKRMLLALVLIFAVVCFSACGEKTEKYTDEEGNVKEYTYVTRETSDKFTLFEDYGHEKWEQMDQAVDKIRQKYGSGAIKRASFLKDDIHGRK